MLQVPPQLNYNQLQTKAFFSVYKPWPIQPISNGGQYWPGQVIRIFFNSLTQGVMDPYKSHIQITVSSNSKTLPVGMLQVDNSAQSFIQQLVIQSRNIQIQRIVQYGILAAYLKDIGMSQLYSEGRQAQGYGYSNIDNFADVYNSNLSSSRHASFVNQNGTSQLLGTSGGIYPTIPTKSGFAFDFDKFSYCASLFSGSFRGHISPLNTAWLDDPKGNPWWWKSWVSGHKGDVKDPLTSNRTGNLQLYGYNNNIRAQYLWAIHQNDYCDASNSLSKAQIRLNQNVMKGFIAAKFSNGLTYETYIPNQIPYYLSYADGLYFQSIPNTCNLTGYSNLLSPNFAKGVRQPFISPTVPQAQIQNGYIVPQKFPVTTRTFKVPIMSASMGYLIPKISALSTVLMQLTIDPYAMFTSGYNDISQMDDVGMGLMQQRAFTIQRVVYNLHSYQFYNSQMDQYLRVNLSSGIAINTHFWQLGNQYQIQNSQSLTNSWPVACNQQALNQILVLFIPLDYQIFSFCRKHYRISNNITKFQLRINMEYFPSQPISGNGGNPVGWDTTGDNSTFIDQIYLSNGFYLNAGFKTVCKINPYNFALNDRIYDITNTHTMYDTSMKDQANYVWGYQSINCDTALGMANVHQNRCVGKAAYPFTFQPYSHSKNFLTGIDCRAAKTFDVLFTTNPQGWFPRPQSMYIYTRSSVIMQYGKDGIVNINK